MSYCQSSDVLDVTGLDYARIIELSDRLATQAQVDTLINDYIAKATREIRKQLGIPIPVHCELHEVDKNLANYTSRVYLGNFDASYCDYDEMIDTFDVQGMVQAILRVYIGGVRRKRTDTTYPWSWLGVGATSGYITFTNANLVDGDLVQITYTYDPYAITGATGVPVNIEEATACLAGIKLLDMLIGIRVVDTDMDAQSESGVTDPTKDKLISNRSQLKQRYRDALASEGYGFNFVPMRGG